MGDLKSCFLWEVPVRPRPRAPFNAPMHFHCDLAPPRIVSWHDKHLGENFADRRPSLSDNKASS